MTHRSPTSRSGSRSPPQARASETSVTYDSIGLAHTRFIPPSLTRATLQKQVARMLINCESLPILQNARKPFGAINRLEAIENGSKFKGKRGATQLDTTANDSVIHELAEILNVGRPVIDSRPTVPHKATVSEGKRGYATSRGFEKLSPRNWAKKTVSSQVTPRKFQAKGISSLPLLSPRRMEYQRRLFPEVDPAASAVVVRKTLIRS